jgi:hypothetical protein
MRQRVAEARGAALATERVRRFGRPAPLPNDADPGCGVMWSHLTIVNRDSSAVSHHTKPRRLWLQI